ncbi:MAG: GyrI-like domain-containing protein [Aquimarina sp.]|nr:GyrI-like domain-containing protein [Aquimarina sp.]
MFLKTLLIHQKIIIGLSDSMSLSNNKTIDLWRKFMPRRNEVLSDQKNYLYDIKVYEEHQDFKHFTPQTIFTKYVGIESLSSENVPVEMEVFIIPEGRYAVFLHKGPASTFHKTLNYIYTDWLPQSEYVLDYRPHFEKIKEGYDPNDINAEEEVWIPIKSL